MTNKLHDKYTEEIDGKTYLVEMYKSGDPMPISYLRYLARLYDITNGNKIFLVDVPVNDHKMKPSCFLKQIKAEKERLLRIKDAVPLQYSNPLPENSDALPENAKKLKRLQFICKLSLVAGLLEVIAFLLWVLYKCGNK